VEQIMAAAMAAVIVRFIGILCDFCRPIIHIFLVKISQKDSKRLEFIREF
jgi:hypothetical protein